jgi:hypothetical protein
MMRRMMDDTWDGGKKRIGKKCLLLLFRLTSFEAGEPGRRIWGRGGGRDGPSTAETEFEEELHCEDE